MEPDTIKKWIEWTLLGTGWSVIRPPERLWYQAQWLNVRSVTISPQPELTYLVGCYPAGVLDGQYALEYIGFGWKEYADGQ